MTSSMTDPMMRDDTLDDLLDDAWMRLIRGKADRRSPFHTPVVATMSADGPRQRVMVLREANRDQGTLRFHTDIRSAKVAAIGQGTRASVLGYDPGARIQLVLSGFIAPASPEAVDAAWDRTTLSSRRCYLAEPGPGTVTATQQSGLPEAMTAREPTRLESEAGRKNFIALTVTLDRIERLYLNARGNSRAVFDRVAENWRGAWLIP